MSAAWPTVNLGEVTRLDLNREPIDASKTYPMVGVLSFARGLFEREPIESGNTSYKHFLRLKPDHIVMSQLFGWEGSLALSDERFAGKYLSPQFPTFLSDSRRLDRSFLGWLMRRPGFWSDLGTRASGMGDRRRTLNPDAFFACEIRLPPLDEQRRIVARIEELAAKVEEALRLRQGAVEELTALGNSEANAIFGRADYTTRPLGDLCHVITDGTHQTPRYVDEGAIFLSAQNVKPFRFLPKVHRKVSFEDYAVYTAKNKPSRGDILLTRVGAGIGEAAVIDQDIDFAIYVSVALIRPDASQITPQFLVHWLNSPIGRSHSRSKTLGRGHSQGNLNLNLLRSFPVPVPPITRQNEIVSELDALQAKVDAVKALQTETTVELEQIPITRAHSLRL